VRAASRRARLRDGGRGAAAAWTDPPGRPSGRLNPSVSLRAGPSTALVHVHWPALKAWSEEEDKVLSPANLVGRFDRRAVKGLSEKLRRPHSSAHRSMFVGDERLDAARRAHKQHHDEQSTNSPSSRRAPIVPSPNRVAIAQLPANAAPNVFLGMMPC
jgi:hypothetical protein